MVVAWTRRTIALAAVLVLSPAAIARADSSNQLTVVGTSDLSDSGLIQNVIQPQFQAEFPGITFNYLPSATGKAIQSAEQGIGTPSALIVHAASLENQFVSGGYSYNNQYGNAIFTNDFVFAGPGSDPAGVAANAAHNIVQAFADVATAGVAGQAMFYSRGGSNSAPGTTVAEHQIWALVGSSNLTPAGVQLCNVSGADGGGETPVKPGTTLGAGNACPDSGTVDGTGGDLPSWYQINSGNQAANVLAANACATSNCYVFTDRGTYAFLASGTDPAGSIPNLKIVTRQNDASAPGGVTELVNYFHVYIINPSKPGEQVNLQGVQDFVTLLTSAAFQSQLRNYLPNSEGGPPFVADASPTITVDQGFPAHARGGTAVSVSGTVTNSEPGYPNPSGAPVSVNEIVGGLPVKLASANTDSSGKFNVTFTPPASGLYQLSTGSISQIERTDVDPQYGDILSPAATASSNVGVTASASIALAQSATGGATVSGSLGPAAPSAKATITVLARRGHGRFTNVGAEKLLAGQTAFAANANLGGGHWQLKVSYADAGQLTAASSATKTITVRVPVTKVTIGHASAKRGSLSLSGRLSHAAGAGTQVKLLGLRATKLATTTAATAGASFKQVEKAALEPRSKKFSIRANLARGYQWILQLELVHKGQPPSFSKVSSVTVS